MVFEGIVLQTIVRQLESKRSIIYEVSERNAGNNGGMDRADASFTHIVLLSSSILACIKHDTYLIDLEGGTFDWIENVDEFNVLGKAPS